MIYLGQIVGLNPFIKLHLKVMRICGLVIFDDQRFHFAHKFRGYLAMFIFTTFMVTQFMDLYNTYGDISKMTTNATFTLLVAATIFQCYRFLYHRSDLLQILCNEIDTKMHKICNFAGSSEKDQQNIKKILAINIRNSTILTIGYYISAFITVHLMCFYGLYKYLHARSFSAEDRKEVNWLMIKSWYPVDMHEYFIPIYIHQVINCYLGLTLIPLLLTLIAACMIYSIAMLQVLKYRCETITDDITDGISTIDRNLSLRQKFHEYIETQLEIGRFVQILDVLTSPTMFFIFVVFSVLMCSLLFQISTMELSLELLVPSTFFFNMLVLLLTFYWHANEIAIHSSDLPNSIYFSKWYMCPKKFKERMLIFMIGTQKPMTLSALYFAMNLDVFISMLKATYSYFTLLTNMSSRR